MRIFIDLQSCQGISKKRGLGRFSLWFANALIRNRASHDVHIIMNANFKNEIEDLTTHFKDILDPNNIHIWHSLPNTAYINPDKFPRESSEIIYEYFIKSLNPDILIIPSLFEGHVDSCIYGFGISKPSFQTVVFIHDLIPFLYPNIYLKSNSIKNFFLTKREQLKKSNYLLTYSESTKMDACRIFNIDIDIIHKVGCAVDECFRIIDIPNPSEIREKYSITKEFLMYTGGTDYRKNIPGLIKAFAKLPDHIKNSHQLLIVCSLTPIEKRKLITLTKSLNLLEHEVLFTGYVTDEELVELYNICKLFVFPSLYEGFGLPILEAMSCGTPTICANNSSLPEVIDYENALFDGNDIDSMATKISEVLSNEKLLNYLSKHAIKRSKEFSWNRVAKNTINILENNFKPHENLDNFSVLNELLDVITSKFPNMTDLQLRQLSKCLSLNFDSEYIS